MAVLKTRKKQRQQLLIILFAVIMLAVGIVLYIGIFKKPNISSESFERGVIDRDIDIDSDVPFLDISIFDEEVLKLFRPWSVLPLEIGPTGKVNPFSQ